MRINAGINFLDWQQWALDTYKDQADSKHSILLAQLHMVVVGICLVAVGFYLWHAIACSIDDPEVEELAARSFVENIPEVRDSSTLSQC